ncbi:MAG: PepSY-like domain-containing protein [Rikenellaceae bacterium]|nr:PepSY-like domain-containing protein [Rikenellaceae bacterium]
MNRLSMLLAAALLFVSATARAGHDRPIKTQQLPAATRQFIAEYFPDQQVALAKEERDILELSYEVVFTNGAKAEFLRNGEWKEVDCKYGALPGKLIPPQIAAHLSQHYPDASAVRIERDRRKWEIELDNGLELTFDSRFNLTGIDD